MTDTKRLRHSVFKTKLAGRIAFVGLWFDGNSKVPIRTTTQIAFESLRNLQRNERNVC